MLNNKTITLVDVHTSACSVASQHHLANGVRCTDSVVIDHGYHELNLL